MKFRTEVEIEKPGWQIAPHHRLLFVGSCFASAIGRRFADSQFRTVVNPYGTMYNPVSILHTLQRLYGSPDDRPRGGAQEAPPDVAVLTLGTNHVYRLKETGKIVDNCEKRPQRLFSEEQLSVSECADVLCQCASLLAGANPEVRIVLTVSPIRYSKYGFHGSQLSKSTLLLAIDDVLRQSRQAGCSSDGSPLWSACYFPAYEILNDELRDYRFYAADMLHPSEQAADYVWQQFRACLFSPEASQMVAEWAPIRQALNHRPFDAESAAYKSFREHTLQQVAAFRLKYGL